MLCQNLINSGSKSRSTNREIFLFNSCVQKEKLISLRFCITMLSILSTPSVYQTLVRGGVLLCKSQQLMLILDTDPKASTKYRTFHPFKPIQICVIWDLSYSIKAISDQIEATVGKINSLFPAVHAYLKSKLCNCVIFSAHKRPFCVLQQWVN